MKGKIDFFQKCVAFPPCQPGMLTSSSEGVIEGTLCIGFLNLGKMGNWKMQKDEYKKLA